MLHALLRLHPAALAFYQLLSEGGWLVVLCGGGCDSVARPRSETAEHIGGDALGCVGGFYMGCVFLGLGFMVSAAPCMVTFHVGVY